MTAAAKRMELAKNNILSAGILMTTLWITNDNATGSLQQVFFYLSIRLYRTIIGIPFNGCLLTRSHEKKKERKRDSTGKSYGSVGGFGGFDTMIYGQPTIRIYLPLMIPIDARLVSATAVV